MQPSMVPPTDGRTTVGRRRDVISATAAAAVFTRQVQRLHCWRPATKSKLNGNTERQKEKEKMRETKQRTNRPTTSEQYNSKHTTSTGGSSSGRLFLFLSLAQHAKLCHTVIQSSFQLAIPILSSIFISLPRTLCFLYSAFSLFFFSTIGVRAMKRDDGDGSG